MAKVSSRAIGLNEALILVALQTVETPARVSTAAELLRAAGHPVGEPSIYVALHRMAACGFVFAAKRNLVGGDGRPRDIGFYRITRAGTSAAAAFARGAAAIRALDRTACRSARLVRKQPVRRAKLVTWSQ